jgi:hypothetical protein
MLLTPPEVRYFLRENTTITRTLSILFSQHNMIFLQVEGVGKAWDSNECDRQFWIIDNVYLPVKFLRGDVQFRVTKIR